MADMKGLSGSIVALVTPFAEDGSVDFRPGRLVDFHLENGTDALLTLGTTGESSTMSHEEDDEVVRRRSRGGTRARYRGKRLEQYAQTMLEKSLSFQKMGADGLLLITPYYNKSNERASTVISPRVLDAVDIPVSCTTCLVAVPLFPRRMSRAWRSIPTLSASKRLLGNLAMRDEKSRATCPMIAFSGGDDRFAHDGVGQSRRYFGWAKCSRKEVHDMCHAWLAGDHAAALKTQLAGIELVDSLFCEVNPIPVKYALELMGFGKAVYRQPLCEPSDAAKATIAAAMKNAGII